MLRDEIAQYTELSGNDGSHTPIGIIGAYLDGYEKGKADAQSEPRWIPVTERLPEPNEIEENGCLRYYLTQNEYGDMKVCSWNGFKWEQIYQLEPTDDEIIAWMPLPECYRGDGKGEQ